MRTMFAVVILYNHKIMSNTEGVYKQTRSCRGETHSEKHKVFLIVFTDTVVHPWTVMIHLPDAAFTHTKDNKHTHTVLEASHANLYGNCTMCVCVTCSDELDQV